MSNTIIIKKLNENVNTTIPYNIEDGLFDVSIYDFGFTKYIWNGDVTYQTGTTYTIKGIINPFTNDTAPLTIETDSVTGKKSYKLKL